MKCVVCEKRGGFNRAVVEVASGAELGALCVGCEREKLGDLSDELGMPGQESCLFCERDGLWALPKWLPSTYETAAGTVSYVEYDSSEAGIRVCDEHLVELGVEDISTPDGIGKEKELSKRVVEE